MVVVVVVCMQEAGWLQEDQVAASKDCGGSETLLIQIQGGDEKIKISKRKMTQAREIQLLHDSFQAIKFEKNADKSLIMTH